MDILRQPLRGLQVSFLKYIGGINAALQTGVESQGHHPPQSVVMPSHQPRHAPASPDAIRSNSAVPEFGSVGGLDPIPTSVPRDAGAGQKKTEYFSTPVRAEIESSRRAQGLLSPVIVGASSKARPVPLKKLHFDVPSWAGSGRLRLGESEYGICRQTSGGFHRNAVDHPEDYELLGGRLRWPHPARHPWCTRASEPGNVYPRDASIQYGGASHVILILADSVPATAS